MTEKTTLVPSVEIAQRLKQHYNPFGLQLKAEIGPSGAFYAWTDTRGESVYTGWHADVQDPEICLDKAFSAAEQAGLLFHPTSYTAHRLRERLLSVEQASALSELVRVARNIHLDSMQNIYEAAKALVGML